MPLLHHLTGKVLFSDAEIRSKGNGELRLAPGFGDALVKLRIEFDRSMVVTSFCRDPEHNEREGGHPNSAHLTHNPKWTDMDGAPLGTFGLDVATHDSSYRADLVKNALILGWCVGINFEKNFVHLDKRLIYTTAAILPVLFGY